MPSTLPLKLQCENNSITLLIKHQYIKLSMFMEIGYLKKSYIAIYGNLEYLSIKWIVSIVEGTSVIERKKWSQARILCPNLNSITEAAVSPAWNLTLRQNLFSYL